MKIWVGVTDNKWFEFLSHADVDEVNFWQPSGRAPFVGLPPGTPFLFKLKKPYNHIAGGGLFVKFVSLPLRLAWEAFGLRNGAGSFAALESLVRPLRADKSAGEFNIGCNVLANPFFFQRDHWIEAPSNWSSNLTQGKTYDTEDEIGDRLWRQIQDRQSLSHQPSFLREEDQPPAYGDDFLTRARLGQGTFRVLVTEAYRRRCAITGEATLPVLEAAHIKPFARGGYNNSFNGLLLRSDYHKLFDAGLVTITPDLHIEVSKRIWEQWSNGKIYYRLHGRRIAVTPENPSERPRTDLLQWHNDNVFER